MGSILEEGDTYKVINRENNLDDSNNDRGLRAEKTEFERWGCSVTVTLSPLWVKKKSAGLRGLQSCYQLIFSVLVFKSQSKGLGWDALELLSCLSHHISFTTMSSRNTNKI